MIEPDIVVDKRGSLELLVLLDCEECNWIFKDRGIEIVGAVKRKVVETDGDDSGDGSHVQEGLKRRPKGEGLMYPGNDPEWIEPNWQQSSKGLWMEEAAADGRSSCREGK